MAPWRCLKLRWEQQRVRGYLAPGANDLPKLRHHTTFQASSNYRYFRQQSRGVAACSTPAMAHQEGETEPIPRTDPHQGFLECLQKHASATRQRQTKTYRTGNKRAESEGTQPVYALMLCFIPQREKRVKTRHVYYVRWTSASGVATLFHHYLSSSLTKSRRDDTVSQDETRDAQDKKKQLL